MKETEIADRMTRRIGKKQTVNQSMQDPITVTMKKDAKPYVPVKSDIQLPVRSDRKYEPVLTNRMHITTAECRIRAQLKPIKRAISP